MNTTYNEILKKNKKQIEQLNKMILNMYAIHNIRYWYSLLSNFPISDNQMEDIMQIEAFTTSITVAYGRLFGEGQGETTKLQKKDLPEDLLSIHDEIINLRHGRYAHHGNDPSIDKSTSIEYSDGRFLVNLSLEIGFYMGAPKTWKSLFEWLDGYMYTSLYKKLDSLTESTGFKWEIDIKPPPRWI